MSTYEHQKLVNGITEGHLEIQSKNGQDCFTFASDLFVELSNREPTFLLYFSMNNTAKVEEAIKSLLTCLRDQKLDFCSKFAGFLHKICETANSQQIASGPRDVAKEDLRFVCTTVSQYVQSHYVPFLTAFALRLKNDPLRDQPDWDYCVTCCFWFLEEIGTEIFKGRDKDPRKAKYLETISKLKQEVYEPLDTSSRTSRDGGGASATTATNRDTSAITKSGQSHPSQPQRSDRTSSSRRLYEDPPPPPRASSYRSDSRIPPATTTRKFASPKKPLPSRPPPPTYAPPPPTSRCSRTPPRSYPPSSNGPARRASPKYTRSPPESKTRENSRTFREDEKALSDRKSSSEIEREKENEKQSTLPPLLLPPPPPPPPVDSAVANGHTGQDETMQAKTSGQEHTWDDYDPSAAAEGLTDELGFFSESIDLNFVDEDAGFMDDDDDVEELPAAKSSATLSETQKGSSSNPQSSGVFSDAVGEKRSVETVVEEGSSLKKAKSEGTKVEQSESIPPPPPPPSTPPPPPPPPLKSPALSPPPTVPSFAVPPASFSAPQQFIYFVVSNSVTPFPSEIAQHFPSYQISVYSCPFAQGQQAHIVFSNGPLNTERSPFYHLLDDISSLFDRWVMSHVCTTSDHNFAHPPISLDSVQALDRLLFSLFPSLYGTCQLDSQCIERAFNKHVVLGLINFLPERRAYFGCSWKASCSVCAKSKETTLFSCFCQLFKLLDIQLIPRTGLSSANHSSFRSCALERIHGTPLFEPLAGAAPPQSSFYPASSVGQPTMPSASFSGAGGFMPVAVPIFGTSPPWQQGQMSPQLSMNTMFLSKISPTPQYGVPPYRTGSVFKQWPQS